MKAKLAVHSQLWSRGVFSLSGPVPKSHIPSQGTQLPHFPALKAGLPFPPCSPAFPCSSASPTPVCPSPASPASSAPATPWQHLFVLSRVGCSAGTSRPGSQILPVPRALLLLDFGLEVLQGVEAAEGVTAHGDVAGEGRRSWLRVGISLRPRSQWGLFHGLGEQQTSCSSLCAAFSSGQVLLAL